MKYETGRTYQLNMRDLDRKLSFFLYDDYNYPIANEIKNGDDNILSEPIKLVNFLRGGGVNNGTFIDIGANIGQFSMTFAAYGYKVYGFDANPVNVQQLRKSAAINGFDAEFIEKAVIDKPGVLRFTSGGPWGNIFDDVAFTTSNDIIEVDGIALDDWYIEAGKPNIDFIKMDIEGSELVALKGMKGLLKENSYPPILTEYCIAYASYNTIAHKESIDTFYKLGYTPYYIKHKETLYRRENFQDRFSYHSAIENYIMLHESSPLLSNFNVITSPIRSTEDFIDDAIYFPDLRFQCGYAYSILHTPELLSETAAVRRYVKAMRNLLDEGTLLHDNQQLEELEKTLNQIESAINNEGV